MQERSIEKHIQTLFMAITLAAIYWAGNSLIEQGKLQERTNGKINLIQAEQEHLKELVEKLSDNLYTASAARKREGVVNRRFDMIETRLLKVEGK